MPGLCQHKLNSTFRQKSVSSKMPRTKGAKKFNDTEVDILLKLGGPGWLSGPTLLSHKVQCAGSNSRKVNGFFSSRTPTSRKFELWQLRRNGKTEARISSRAQVRILGRLMVLFIPDSSPLGNSDYGSYDGTERQKRLN